MPGWIITEDRMYLFTLRKITREHYSDKADLDSKQWSAYIIVERISMRSRLTSYKVHFYCLKEQLRIV